MTNAGTASGADVRAGAAAAPLPDATALEGYGAQLASQRQRAGLGVTDIAARLRLHPDQVRAIEQENLARLPEPPYVRGFVRGYARVLNMDPVPLLSDLNAKLAPPPVSEGGDAGGKYVDDRSAARERDSRWLVGIAVASLIAVGLVGWQTIQRAAPTQVTPVVFAPAAAPTAVVTTAADNNAPVSGEAAAVPPAAVGPAAPVPAESPRTNEAPPPTDLPRTNEAPRTSDAPRTTETQPPVAAASTGEAAPALVLRFTGASWVEVTDAKGKILLSQLSTPGAEHVFDGDLPLNVLIGDATRTSVEVRGVGFNLLPIMRNNVARFTVK